MNTLRDTTFFVATPCGTSSEPMPRSQLIRELTSHQMRWSQLIWCPGEQRWKPAREIHGLMGMLPMIPRPRAVEVADSTTGEFATAPPVASSPPPAVVTDHPAVRSNAPSSLQGSQAISPTEVLATSVPTPLAARRVTTVRVATPRTKALHIPQTNEEILAVKPLEGYLTVILRFLKIPLAAMISVFLTIYFMPLKARAALAESANSDQFVLWEVIETMIFKRVDSIKRSVWLQDGMGMNAVLNLSKPMRIRGTLQLKASTAKVIRLQVQGRCGADGKMLLMDQGVEILPGTRSVEIFSVVASQGAFCFTGTCQDGAPDQAIPAILTLDTDF